LTDFERRLIGELQHDLPVHKQPYAVIAGRMGVSEDVILENIQSMLHRGVIRKIGAILRHRKIGYHANALCVWKVPEDRTDEIGEMFAELAMVTHCYERHMHPEWEYNLYTMVHAKTKEECENFIATMSQLSGMSDFKIFYSTAELKKTSMHYF
jgi:siroheme decarboxylase